MGDLSLNPEVVAKRRELFLDLIAANGGNEWKAALAVGYPNTTALRAARKADPEFARKWDEAIEASNAVLEHHAIERGTIGIEKPIYYQGEIAGVERVPDSNLLVTVMKARMPDKYSEKREIKGTVQHNVKVGVALIPMLAPSNEDWERTSIAHEAPLALPAPKVEKDKA